MSPSVGCREIAKISYLTDALSPLSQSTLGPQPCPGKANNLSYWDNIIRTSGDAKVESVSCAKFMTSPGLQALVLVRHHSTGSIANVYVYAKILSDKPARIFKLSGLLHGKAKISVYNTVLTAQAQNSSTRSEERRVGKE